MCSYDGTLAPIVEDPDKAYINDTTRETIMKLASQMPVVIISGRSIQKLAQKNFIGVALPEGLVTASDVIANPSATTDQLQKRQGLSPTDAGAPMSNHICPGLWYAGSHGHELVKVWCPGYVRPSQAPSQTSREEGSVAGENVAGKGTVATGVGAPSLGQSLDIPGLGVAPTTLDRGVEATRQQIVGENQSLLQTYRVFGSDSLSTLYKVFQDLQGKVKDEEFPGASVESNLFSVSVHYRRMHDASAEKIKALEALVDDIVNSSQGQLVKRLGKMVFEVRPAGKWNKGTAATSILSAVLNLSEDIESTADLAGSGQVDWQKKYTIAIGDDRTDEDMFLSLQQQVQKGVIGHALNVVVVDAQKQRDAINAHSDIVSGVGKDEIARKKQRVRDAKVRQSEELGDQQTQVGLQAKELTDSAMGVNLGGSHAGNELEMVDLGEVLNRDSCANGYLIEPTGVYAFMDILHQKVVTEQMLN